MTWEENPQYRHSAIETNLSHVSQIPNWLYDRKNIIYDVSCIQKGKRLGHGNFGVVFEGKIHLGNAV